jgi:general secretion pathway protein J
MNAVSPKRVRGIAASRRGERGFALLEILVAFVILALGLAAILAGVSVAMRSDARTQTSRSADDRASRWARWRPIHLAANGHRHSVQRSVAQPGSRQARTFSIQYRDRVLGRGRSSSGGRYRRQARRPETRAAGGQAMIMATRNRRWRRAGRRRRGEQGLTLIELLLALAILAVLTGFLAGGLSIGRRAFDADRSSEVRSETDVAIQAISSLIASALPVPASTANPKSGVVFDGRQETLSFVGLSEGRSLRGGPHLIRLRRSGMDLVVDVVGSAPETAGDAAAAPTRVVALSGVRDIRFGYFGSVKPSGRPGWQGQWFRAEHLPDLVSIQIDFEDARRNEPARIIALRQG